MGFNQISIQNTIISAPSITILLSILDKYLYGKNNGCLLCTTYLRDRFISANNFDLSYIDGGCKLKAKTTVIKHICLMKVDFWKSSWIRIPDKLHCHGKDNNLKSSK